jgi:hypothetical protein
MPRNGFYYNHDDGVLELHHKGVRRSGGTVVTVAPSSSSYLADYHTTGTADDVEINLAIASLTDGGTVVLAPGTYNLAASISITTNKRYVITGYGAKLVPGANVTAIVISQGVGGNAMGAGVDGIEIDGGSVNGQTGIKFLDTDRAFIMNFRISNCAVGILMESTATFWVEGTAIENGLVTDCTTGWKAVAADAASFGETHVRDVGFNSTLDSGIGIDWQTNSNFYRSSLVGVTIWVRNNQTGWKTAANMTGLYGHVGIEDQGTPTNVIGIDVVTGATGGDNMFLHVLFTGTFTTKVRDTGSLGFWFWNSGGRYNDLNSLVSILNVNQLSATSIITANGGAGYIHGSTHTDSGGGALSLNTQAIEIWKQTLTSNITSLALANPTAGQIFTLMLIQDGTGSRTLSSPSANIKWAGGATPTLTTTASRRDIFRFFYDGTNWYELSRSMNVQA